MTAPLSSSINRYLQSLERRARIIALLRTAGRAAALAAAWLLAEALLDRWLHLSQVIRAALFIIALFSICAILVLPIHTLFRAPRHHLATAAMAEARTPRFAGRLRTLVFQASERPESRGSPEFLLSLMDEVENELDAVPPAKLVRWSSTLPPWVLALALSAILAALFTVESLAMPTLLVRFLRPLDDIPPVTTTRIAVRPGHQRLPRGQSLVIRAAVQNHTGPVDLFTSPDGQTWNRMLMLPSADGQHVATLGPLQRDLQYYVASGDARSITYQVSIVRPPAIVQYTLQCQYPPHTGLAPDTRTQPDASFDLPSGTRVILTITSDQSLRSAILHLGQRRLIGVRRGQPRALSFDFTADHTLDGTLELTSAAGVSSTAPIPMRLRARPDLAPVPKLLTPSGTLQLPHNASLPIRYEAFDDYGIAELTLTADVNGHPRQTWPLPPGKSPRQNEGSLEIDLATLKLKDGDIVSLQLLARDAGGLDSHGAPLHLLVAPRRIDEPLLALLSELRIAADAAAFAPAELQAAQNSLSRLVRLLNAPESERYAERVRAAASLTAAVERLAQSHRALLRASARGASGTLAVALAAAVDRLTIDHAAAERLVSLDAAGADASVLVQEIHALQTAIRENQTLLKRLADGQLALILRFARENLATLPTTRPADPAAAAPHDPVRQSLQTSLDNGLRRLGLHRLRGDALDRNLAQRTQARDQLLRAAESIDFDPAANEWVLALLGTGRTVPPLPARLLSASAAETVRRDTDPVRAYDLRLAAAAATQLQRQAAATARPETLADQLADFARAIDVLQEEHALRRAAAEAGVHWRASIPGADAAAARTRLRILEAPPRPTTRATTAPAIPESDELLVLRASTETFLHNYTIAAAIEDRLDVAARTRGIPADPLPRRHAAQALMTLDAALVRQADLNDQTHRRQELAITDAELAARQQEIAAAIAAIPHLAANRSALSSAAAHAAAAAAALAAAPPNHSAARAQQDSVSFFLDQAWISSVRLAHRLRLPLAPAFHLLLKSSSDLSRPAEVAQRPDLPPAPPRNPPPIEPKPGAPPATAPASPAEPADPVDLYFSAIRNASTGR